MIPLIRDSVRFRRLLTVPFGLSVGIGLVSGCTRSAIIEPVEIQPRVAAYRCGAAGSLTIENFQTSVHVIPSRGLAVELPASPPGSTSRYGEAPYALLLEGREALWMETGKKPVTCRR